MKCFSQIFLTILLAGIFFFQGYTQVAVNTDDSPAESSAMLDVKSVTRGFLFPRMNSGERAAIASPATGLIVYQTDSPAGFYYYTGSQWIKLQESITETDPVFSAWDKSTGIIIPSTQVTDFANAVSATTAVTANTAKISYPLADETKLAGIQAGAEVNVQSDWNATSGDAQILNKPVLEGLHVRMDITSGAMITFDGTNWVAKNPYFSNPGSGGPVNNMQPSLVVNFCIAVQGIFPQRNDSDPFIGEICMFGFNFPPRGWAQCNGQLLPLSQNTALFALLGTQYGGNGKSNFALPDLQDNAAMNQGQGPGLTDRYIGEQGGTDNFWLLPSEIPVHNHTIVYQ